jgi:hypothetical protein
MHQTSTCERRAHVNVALNEPELRALDRFAFEHQQPHARKLSRGGIMRAALVHFLNSKQPALPTATVRHRSRHE